MAMSLVAGLMMVGNAMITAGTWAIGWGKAFQLFALGAGLSAISRSLVPDAEASALTDNALTVREPAGSKKIIYGRARVGGTIVYLDTTGDDNAYLHMVIAVAPHVLDAYEKIYFGDKIIYDTSQSPALLADYANHVRLKLYDGTQTTADSDLVAESTQWTTDHKLLGTAYIYVRLKHSVDLFSQGLPNVSAVVRGNKVYNPANAQTEWSTNPALCLHDYLTNSVYGMGESSSSVNFAQFVSAAATCDETVQILNDSGNPVTQKRYEANGVLNTAVSRKSNIENLLSAMGGKLVFSGGEYFITPAKYVAPTVTIDESMLVGPIQVQTKQTHRSVFNGVKGMFLDADNNYIMSDYPAIASSAYAVTDGDPIYLDMILPFTTNQVAAQRMAKMALLQSRKQTTVVLPCNLAAIKFKTGDNIMVTNAKMGWSSKIFQVTSWTISPNNNGGMQVNVNAIETDSTLYNWSTSDQRDYISGGEVSIYDGSVATAPTSLTATATSTLASDGTVRPAILATWTASADVFTRNYDFQISTDNTNFESIILDSDATRYVLENVQTGTTYYLRVRAINEIGVKSAFATVTTSNSGDTTAPTVPSDLVALGGIKLISLTWTRPTETDYSHAEIYENTVNSTQQAQLIAKVSGTSYVREGLAPLAQRYYFIRVVDFSGNASSNSSIVTALADFVDTDAVEDAAITNAKIANLAVNNAKIDGAIFSDAYSAGTSGWKIDKAGDAEFNDATFRGTLTAASGTLGDIVLAANGDIRSGQTAYDSGTGFFLGDVAGTPKFSIGNSAGAKMTWDGTSLFIKGVQKLTAAGDEALAVATTGGQTNSTSYVKVAEISIGVSGTIRTKATIAGGSSLTNAYAQFRKNGNSYKSFSKSGVGYVEYVDTSESVSSGDTIELWLEVGAPNQVAFWGNFGVYVQDGGDAVVTLEV